MSENICKDCQQVITKVEGTKYYSVELSGKSFSVCSNCWKSKKDDYKKKLVEEKIKDLERESRSSGGNRKYDKNDWLVMGVQVWKTQMERGGDLHGSNFSPCPGCNEWVEDRDEIDNHNQTCKDKIADKKELSSLRDKISSLDQRQKERLKELEKKYGEPDRDDPPKKKDKVKTSILSYFKKNNIKSIKLENNKLIIKYNHKEEEEEEAKTTELQQIRDYIQSNSRNNQLTLEDLQQIDNDNPNTEKPFNYTPWLIGGGIAVVLVIIGIILYRRNKNK